MLQPLQDIGGLKFMNRIKDAFNHGKAFISFVTGGDPDLETTKELILGMQEAGADLIEIGIPFSDPLAEGIVIQDANERALQGGCTTDKLFDMLERIQGDIKVPIAFLTYLNPIYTYGKERFMKRCQEAGIGGLIIPDLPFEEREELSSICDAYEVDLIPLIAPTSQERIQMIAKEAKGFVYCVSSLGVTGVRTNITTDIKFMVDQVKEVSNLPCAIGFGISSPEQAKTMAEVADGVIVGSAIVKIVEKYGRESLEPVKTYVREMKEAVTKHK